MSLNNFQLLDEISNDIWGRKHFLGVFPFDKKPKIRFYPSCLILNNQNHNQPGQHWIALYFHSKNICEFFDSLGMSPEFYNLLDYIKLYSKQVNFASYPIQDNSSYYCGYYCIYFILLRSRNLEFKFILDLFEKKNLKNNDKKIKNLL